MEFAVPFCTWRRLGSASTVLLATHLLFNVSPEAAKAWVTFTTESLLAKFSNEAVDSYVLLYSSTELISAAMKGWVSITAMLSPDTTKEAAAIAEDLNEETMAEERAVLERVVSLPPGTTKLSPSITPFMDKGVVVVVVVLFFGVREGLLNRDILGKTTEEFVFAVPRRVVVG